MVRIATWNLLHAVSTNGVSAPDYLGHQASLTGADIIGLQEVDRDQIRSGMSHQTREVALALNMPYWFFAPAIVGTPGQEWTKAHDESIHSHKHCDESGEAHYGIGLASRYPLSHIEVMRFAPAPISLPLLVPGPKGAQIMKVADEPRIALIAQVDCPGGPIMVATTHLSFVPGFNVRQLRAITRRLAEFEMPTLLFGDFNLPSGLPKLITGWDSLAKIATYPVNKPKIQFDHVLSRGIRKGAVVRAQKSARAISLGISDHCAVTVDLAL